MNYLNEFLSTGVVAPIRNSFFREVQLMFADMFSKLFKYFLLALFIGFLFSFVLIALIYFIARQPANDLYSPTEMPKLLQPNSMMSSTVPMTEPYLMNVTYNRLERTAEQNYELRLNEYYFRDGDNLNEICGRFNVDLEEVRRINQLGESNAISPGTWIYIPLN